MDEKRTLWNFLGFTLVISVAFSSPAQNVPTGDFVGKNRPKPPGAFSPPKSGTGGKKGFGPSLNKPAPKTFGSGDSYIATGKTEGTKPAKRNRRMQPPDLLSKRPPGMAEATDKDITDENFPDLIKNFDYPNADIGDMVKAISELTGKNFIIDPAVKGKITIIAPTQITVAEAYKAFLSALAINRYTVVPSGKFLKIRPAASAIRGSLKTYSGAYAPDTDAMITRIIQLKYISAKEVFNGLGQTILVSREGEVRPYEPTNTLIISDYGSNVARVMSILRKLDVPGFDEQIEVMRVKFAKASELAELIDQIINKGKNGKKGKKGFTSGIPRFSPLNKKNQATNQAFSLVIPDERTNSLIVVGNKRGIRKIKRLVRKLDFRLRPEDAGGIHVYYVKFGDAEELSQTLTGIAQASEQSKSKTGAQNKSPSAFAPAVAGGNVIFGGDVKIVADKTSNSLVISAAKPDYEVVTSILRKLDIPRDQVFVEGILMELNSTKSNTWGINYYNFPVAGTVAGRSGFISNKDASTQIMNIGETGGVLGFGSGGVSDVSIGGTNFKIPSLVGFINFLAGVTNANILSTPTLMALDNQEAEIEIGEKVPVGATVNTAATGVTTTTPDREDVTLQLKLKPHISPGSNKMRLEIELKQDGIAERQVEASDAGGSGLTTTKRNAKTNVIVRDGDTVVLGGLTREKESENITKIPLLGDIPILGWLFKGKTTSKVKENLVMFLTPTIIRTEQDSAHLVKQTLAKRVDFIERNMGGKDSLGSVLDQMKLMENGKISDPE